VKRDGKRKVVREKKKKEEGVFIIGKKEEVTRIYNGEQ